jgi:hypothetical protein
VHTARTVEPAVRAAIFERGHHLLRRFRLFLAASAVGFGLLCVSTAEAAGSLVATVTRNSIALTTTSGAKVSTLPAGTYLIVVRDRSVHQNFHLLNPPQFDKRTRLAFVGVVTWRVRLYAGAYRYVSDARKPSLQGSFRVR